jgi:mRNA interferase MazF
MKFMTNYKFGDTVLVAFPFTNLTQTKKRPALVLFAGNDGDVIICRVTSKEYTSKHDVELKQWRSSGLLVASWVRLHKIVTVDQGKIDKKLGALAAGDLKEEKKIISKKLSKILE